MQCKTEVESVMVNIQSGKEEKGDAMHKLLASLHLGQSRFHRYQAIVFDIGNVLLTCGPRYMFTERVRGEPERIKAFFAEALTQEALDRMDCGESIKTVIDECIEQQPKHKEWLQLYRDQWHLTMGPLIADMNSLATDLISFNHQVLALSNWPTEKIAFLKEYVPVLAKFNGVIYSGEVGLAKPNPAIFKHMLNKFQIKIPGQVLFIDDMEANVRSAAEVGIDVYHFVDSEQFAKDMLISRFAGIPVSFD